MYKIQIETILKYNFTPNELAKIKIFEKTHFWQECGEIRQFHTLLVFFGTIYQYVSILKTYSFT